MLLIEHNEDIYMDLKLICESLEKELQKLFSDLESGMAEREDSRAFGAMVEKRMTSHWEQICKTLGAEHIPNPGRRTIYDFACKIQGTVFGFDVKTKDLDSTKYSDGGVCAVGNLLKFMANDKGVFVVVEFGHNRAQADKNLRDLEYIKVAPFHLLPENCFRIENLGTGQVRLNYSINQVWEEIDWKRSYKKFFDIFTGLAILHYERVGRDAIKRADSVREFQKNNYVSFKFVR